MTQSKDDIYWCRFSDVTNKQISTVSSIFLGIVLVLFAFTIYRLVKLIKLKVNRSVIIIHFLLIFWQALFLIQYGLSVGMYVSIQNLHDKGKQYDKYPEAFKNVLPRIIAGFDMLLGPLLMTILMTVPYYWVKNIIFFMERISDNSTPNRGIKLVNTIILVYLIVSRLGYLGIESLYYILSAQEMVKIFRIIRFYISGESILSGAIIVFGGVVLIRNFSKIAVVDQQDKSRIKKQFIMLTIVCVFRVIVNATYIFSLFQNKWISQCLTSSQTFQMIHFCIGVPAVHIFPVVVILCLYMREDSTLSRNVSHSLLSSSTVSEKEQSFLG